MTDLAQYNIVIIVVAILVGLIVAFWLFRGPGRGSGGNAPTPAQTSSRDGAEGNALTDEYSAATRDIAGEMLGVDAHVTIPGADGPPDNLQTMKGVGPKLAAQLNQAGITRFDQLAALTPNEIAYLDAQMGAFQGRIARDRLVEQAHYLSRGDTDGFEATFGRLGGGA